MKYIIVIVAIYIIFTNYTYAYEASIFNFQEVLEITKTGDNFLNNFIGDIDAHIDVFDSSDVYLSYLEDSGFGSIEGDVKREHVDMSGSVAFMGDKVYFYQRNILSNKNTNFEKISVHAFNGEKLDVLYLHRKLPNGIFSATGFINDDNTVKVDKINPFFQLSNLTDNNVSGYLSNLNNLRILGQENKNNLQCTVVEGSIAQSDSVVTLWLSHRFMLRPIYIEMKSNIWATQITNYYKEYDNYVYPQEKIIETFFISNQDKLQPIERYSLHIHDNFEINTDIPYELFEIKYPIGTPIHDVRTNQLYISGEVMENDNMN